MSFNSLKANREANKQKLIDELNKFSSGSTQKNSSEDERFWKPEVDKAGNGYAVIRFLPAPEGEDYPFIRRWDHGFQGPGGWYIENSLTTIGQQDPVSEYNSKLWNAGSEAMKEQARKQKRRLHYIANIMVVKDPANPANEGKIFLYKFGKKIFDKINDLMNPSFQDEEPIIPFDMWDGANFKLKIRQVEGYRNYDKSEFDSPAPISEDDAKLEKIYNSLHKLQPFLDPKEFKSYDELKAKLDRVLGVTASAKPDYDSAEDMSEESVDNTPSWNSSTSETKDDAPWSTASSSNDDEDDEFEFFKKLKEA